MCDYNCYNGITNIIIELGKSTVRIGNSKKKKFNSATVISFIIPKGSSMTGNLNKDGGTVSFNLKK